jgi:hypothetical protein
MRKEITDIYKEKFEIIEEIKKLVEKEKMDITYKNKINPNMLSINTKKEITAEMYPNIVM